VFADIVSPTGTFGPATSGPLAMMSVIISILFESILHLSSFYTLEDLKWHA
jgi:hypothetical protein